MKCEKFGVQIELLGKRDTKIYRAVEHYGLRNNFHNYCQWVRRAKYSEDIPFKLATHIQIFSV